MKFFNHIHRKVVADNLPFGQSGKVMAYLRYAVGEIILVVIGILIALQINNWNENQKLNKSRQVYYQQLLIDLNKDIESAKKFIANFKKSAVNTIITLNFMRKRI